MHHSNRIANGLGKVSAYYRDRGYVNAGVASVTPSAHPAPDALGEGQLTSSREAGNL